jgi:hypothetical protein
MPGKQFRDPADDARCVNSSIALARSNSAASSNLHPRLALEIFHDVEKPIVYVWVVVELDLDLVEVTQRILKKTRSAGADQMTDLPVSPVTYVEYRLLPLRHTAGPRRRGLPRAHVGAKRQLLHGPSAILHSPTVFLLKRAAEYSTGAARSPKRVAWAAGAVRPVWTVGHRREDLVLGSGASCWVALLWRPSRFAV